MFLSKCETFALQIAYAWVAELFSKWGEQVHAIKFRTFLWFECQPWRHKHWTMTSLTFVSMFKQFYSKFDKPSTTPIYTKPYLSYTTVCWAHNCNDLLFLVLHKNNLL